MSFVKKHKIIIIFTSIMIFFGLVVSIPSLAKLKNRNTIYTASSWDGSVATSYKKGDGTLENPYIISNGSEFAFFVEQLKTTDYKDVYFELSNDIIINFGIFEYDEEQGLKYTEENISYYVKEYTNEYYDNINYEGNSVGNLNITSTISNFKGNLNGKSFTIFGIYIYDSLEENVSLFKNLEGTITDLYISNSVTYGKGDVSGLAVNANNSTLTNIVYNGLVINKSPSKVSENIVEPISITTTQEEISTLLKLPEVSIEGAIKSVKLTGEYTSTNLDSINTIKINGVDINSNVFEIDFGTSLLNESSIVTSSTMETTLNFNNLKYIIEYYDDTTSGLISNSTNNSLNQIINKSNIYGNYISSGLVGKANGNLQITNSYNTGNINSNYISSGIIGLIKNNSNHVTITNVYNKGLINGLNSGAIISTAIENTGNININNSINTSINYAINTASNSIINIFNSLSLNGLSIYNGNTNGTFNQTTTENLYAKENLNNLYYNEFVSLEDATINVNNVWIYENDSLPILYIDDLNNPIANINLNKYSWNNLSTELNVIRLTNSITFAIDDVSSVNPVKEKYYYITNSRVALSIEELNNVATWKLYENNVTIEESGYYVIYAKIVDYNGNITYMNTDVIALNVSGFLTNISMNNKEWTTNKSDLIDIYTNDDINLTIYAQDDLYGINSIEYYISNQELTEEEIGAITEWTIYSNNITINAPGKYVIYAKVVNGESITKYLNTDYIVYNGYSETLNIGSSNINYDTNYITTKSLLTLTFTSDFEMDYKEGYTHNLISNILLPLGTKITLIDKYNNKIYNKIIDTEADLYGYNDSCIGISNCSKYATYSFNIFKEIGASDAYYDESINYNKILKKEKYVMIIDFNNTNLVENYYDISFYLAIKSNEDKVLYETLNNTIENINLYSNINGTEITTTHNLISDYVNQSIYYNSDSETTINLNNEISYSMMNNKNIIDTNYESKKVGLLIGLYNDLGQQINKQYVDNMIFEINGKEYYSNTDNSIKINLGSVVDYQTKTLKIKTKENSSALTNGTYYIKINKFISEDGYYYDSLYNDEINIPLIVENQTSIVPDYSFDIQMLTESVILDKTLESHLVSFNINYLGSLVEPNIKISLYEKNDLTAYNQNYTLVDIKQYTSDNLVAADSKKYFVDVLNPTFNLNLIPNRLNNNGYKFVFELYDGIKKITRIEKYFIVK